ncbi:preprotein translocase subunit SecY [Aquihabitans sp. McL0605]|uniref:preprotein translocase subunit SecY n=1 Tax=Aquihabitans sp. McL0605 TaxID=3415671 RepID=UPI003CEE7668
MSTLRNVFKIPELRNKLLFTLLMIALYRLGAHIPVPGIDLGQIKEIQDKADSSGVLNLLQTFSGGAITQFAVFALGIMPYITASIIMQILAVVIPKLEQWQEQGAVGQRKITQWTRYLGVAIALLQGTGITYLFHTGGGGFGSKVDTAGLDVFGDNYNALRFALVVLTLTTGFALLMWMGEVITQRGVGNGMSLLIFASVVSQMPRNFLTVQQEKNTATMIGVALMFIVLMVGIVFVEQGVRRIPVQFAKRQVGRKMFGGQSTYIPLKVNGAGVISIIFASSVLYLPVILSQILPVGDATAENPNIWWDIQQFVDQHLTKSTSPAYLTVYGLLIILFAYFYTAIQFDPHKQADQIRKQGGFIPGIRPGYQTERYLAKILSRITLPGALFVAAIALIPAFVLGKILGNTAGGQRLGFFGISILIAVGVAIETVKQVDGQLMMRNYEGFLNTKTKSKSSSK